MPMPLHLSCRIEILSLVTDVIHIIAVTKLALARLRHSFDRVEADHLFVPCENTIRYSCLSLLEKLILAAAELFSSSVI